MGIIHTVNKNITEEQLLNTKVYYPGTEQEWIDLKEAVRKFLNNSKEVNQETVRDIANFLIERNDYKNSLVDIIKKLENCFNLSYIQGENSQIELCPSDDDKNTGQFYAQGGNKRLIAYAMKLLKNEFKFQELVIQFYPKFDRRDKANRNNKKTIKHKIKC